MSNRSVRWGILSTARIAETACMPALGQTKRGELVAVASRNQEMEMEIIELNSLIWW